MKYLIILAILALVAVSLCATTTAQGYVIVGVRDKKINNENVTAINLTVMSVQVHYSGFETPGNNTGSNETGNNTTESNETGVVNTSSGWVTVFQGSKNFNLLNYNEDFVGVLGNTSLAAGNYEQIRVYISSATITVDNTTSNLDIPSNVLKIVGGFEIESNTTLVLVLDFDAEHSIIRNNNGYRLKPVIKLEKFKSNSTDLGEVGNDIGKNLQKISQD